MLKPVFCSVAPQTPISHAVRGEEVDFRVATVPTGHGESLVIRVLDRAQIRLDFADLGFDEIANATLDPRS